MPGQAAPESPDRGSAAQLSPDPVSVDQALAGHIHRLLRDVPDFPTPGVLFKDIGPLLADPSGLADVVAALAARVTATGSTVVAGIESRGFLLGAPAAVAAGVSFVPLRKAGRLPGPVEKVSYALEYGTAELECQHGLIPAAARVLIIDDVLATGGTALAGAELIRAVGAEPVEIAVLLEIPFLRGRERVAPLPVVSLATA